MNQLKGKISRVLVICIVLFSSIITLVMTLIQLRLDYDYGMGVIDQRIDQIQLTNIDAIKQSIWTMDNASVQLQLDGLARLPDIIYVELKDLNNKIAASSGKIDTKNTLEKEFPVFQVYRGGETHLGDIRVVATKEELYQHLIDTVLVILVTQAVKTFAVSLFILFVFYYLVTRHLEDIADYLEGVNIKIEPQHIKLNRKTLNMQKGDELDRVAGSINKMADMSHEDYEDLKRSQADLAKSEARFASIFNSLADAVVFIGVDKRIVLINPAFSILFGYAENEVVGRVPGFLFAKKENKREIDPFEFNNKDGGQKLLYEALYEDSSRKLIEGETLRGEVRVAEGTLLGYVWVIRDITAKKAMEQEKRRLENDLQKSQKMEAIGLMAGGVAHDFNNMLSSIIGFAELASEKLKQNDVSSINKYLSNVLKSGKRAADLIKQMLAFSRSVPSEPEIINVNKVILDVSDMMRPLLTSSVEIEFDIEENVPNIKFDVTQLHQVLINLCVNARDAMGGKGVVTICLRFKQGLRLVCDSCHKKIQGDFVSIIVKDEGLGISAEYYSNVFEPFHTTKEVGRGTGMGLSVVHGILHKHNSHVVIDSRLGEWTELEVLVPPCYEAYAQVKENEKAVTDIKSVKDKHIMVVDDEVMLVEFLSDFLDGYGFRVEVCTGSGDAYRKLLDNPEKYCLIITDQTMPGMSGLELIKRIRESNVNVPVILYSGYSDHVNGKLLKELKIVEYLQKPVDNQKLLKRVSEILS